jgi:hypothetical protein
VNGFLDLDSFLELSLLQLDAYPALQLIYVANRVEAEDGGRAAIGSAEAFHAFHRGCLPRTVWSDQAEDLSVVDLERDIIDSDKGFVRLPQSGNFYDWCRSIGHLASLCEVVWMGKLNLGHVDPAVHANLLSATPRNVIVNQSVILAIATV